MATVNMSNKNNFSATLWINGKSSVRRSAVAASNTNLNITEFSVNL